MDLAELYENFRDRWGFADGAEIPENVEEVKDTLVNLINEKILQESSIYAEGQSVFSLHNADFIVYKDASSGEEVYQKDEPVIGEYSIPQLLQDKELGMEVDFLIQYRISV